ncbi:hypothetical protein SAMD00019534_049940 [Acytostelium subglobosum LB1]|uniref:hypothetical protein n=1 Tax=Acytostelium subglobosum LB1 TaxID=1410327 RepID=UPI0006448523|nr:hypothetical protein SAMD00019534_049940 [Acytostelium subglobosum LB1]GAM21819.1 hypothetical protein SAMD00019534_049940 [Acytostelium subglobosum LB1]|eukprot:XP_012754919.1 hypothetical protein SAMD00019534_049940 [Acytostelium subglobosum LB1]
MAPPKNTGKTSGSAASGAASASNANANANAPQELSKKDKSALQNVSKLYEEQKFKKALKAADEFLRQHPTNTDCLCYKTLIYYSLDRKQDAHDLAKSVLRTNLSSFTAWHTLGFLHRNDKNYTEALKCFRNAHKNNKESSIILKDLSNIQIHLRDLTGLKDSYISMLHLQPTTKSHWIGLITTYHILGNLQLALNIFDDFMEILDHKEIEGIKYSELILYKVQLLEEMGQFDKALDLIRKEEKKLLGKQDVKQKIGELLIKKGTRGEAEKIFKDLLKTNTENLTYHQRLWETKGVLSLDNLNQDQVNQLTNMYVELAKVYPKSMMIQKIPLRFLAGEEFRTHLAMFSKNFLTKGIPSLFNNLKTIYGNKDKVAIIEQLFLSHIESLNTNGTLNGFTEQEPPTTAMWCMYFLAQHYDRLRDATQAFTYADMAITHTPTTIDAYIIKAKIQKHLGDLKSAAATYEYARSLDLADRYLNTKSAMYATKNDDVAGSEAIISYMIEKSESFLNVITDFQSTRYEISAGKSWMRQGEYAKALKMLHLVDKHFSEFIEDQFDFQNHMQRRLTLRSYIQFLRWEDNVFDNQPYHDAAVLIIKIYLILLKNPWVPHPETEEEKKAATEKKPKPVTDSEGNPKPVDDDPKGDKLATVPDVLVPAIKFLNNLLKFTPNSIQAHELACQVYLEKRKYLLVLQSLLKLRSMCPDNAEYHRHLCAFFVRVEQDKDVKAPVREIIDNHRAELLGANTTLQQYNDNYANNHKQSVAHKFVAGEALLAIAPAAKEQAVALMLDVDGTTASWENCYENMTRIQSLFGQEITQQYKQKCHARFPMCKHFQEVVVEAIAAPTTNGSGDVDALCKATNEVNIDSGNKQ